MSHTERRFRQRYAAAPLKLEVRQLNMLGRAGRRHLAIARNFSLGGVSMISPIKIKPGKPILISLTSDSHSLQRIPATVVRAERKNGEFIYAVKFSMGSIPEAASRGAYSVLQKLEDALKIQGSTQLSH